MTSQTIRSYRDLQTWQRAMELAAECYEVTSRLPVEERYGLAIQIRRAAVSIPSNIAEGHNGRTHQVFMNHLTIALGSQAELETQLELSARLLQVDVEKAQALASEVGKLLHGLRAMLSRSSRPARPAFHVVVPSH